MTQKAAKNESVHLFTIIVPGYGSKRKWQDPNLAEDLNETFNFPNHLEIEMKKRLKYQHSVQHAILGKVV